jgi:hypothetical protein
MRCYFMKQCHIFKVEFLEAKDDAGRIAEARALFEEKASQIGADGFEVWDGPRFLYRYPEVHKEHD